MQCHGIGTRELEGNVGRCQELGQRAGGGELRVQASSHLSAEQIGVIEDLQLRDIRKLLQSLLQRSGRQVEP